MTSSSNSPFPPEFLAKEFYGFKIYATCIITVYLYDSIMRIRKDWIWYSKKVWSMFDIISYLLEKINSLAYIISVLLFLHLHTRSSCESLETLTLCYYAIGIGIQCVILLSILRAKYSNSIPLIIFLCLIALVTCTLHAANIFEFNEFIVGNDGNCYQENEQIQQKWIIVAFVMMMSFSWITFGLISVKIYRNRKRNEIFGNTRRWRSILFGDGLIYLATNALFQLLNVIFILGKQSYIVRFANVIPAFLVTSVCCQRLLVLGARSTRQRSSIIQSTPLPSSHQRNNNPTFPPEMTINNNTLEFPQPTVRHPRHPTLRTHSARSQSPTSITIAPPTPIMNSDFSSSLLSIMNNFTTMNNNTLNNHLHNSLRNSLQSFGKNSSGHNTMKSLHSNNSNSRHSSTLSSRQNPDNLRPESRNSSLQANSNPQNQTRSSHESRRSNRSILSTIQNVFRNSRENRSRDRINDDQNQNDIYYFRYSNVENDEDIYMFPKIPARSASNT